MQTLRDATDTAANINPANTITDKRGYARRWKFSTRHVDNLIAQGLPNLKIGSRRVRIIIPEADAWMGDRFSACRRGPASRVRPAPEASDAAQAAA